MTFGVDVTNLFQLMFTLPNSRHNEHEADRIGLELMSRACFNPEAMAHVFERLGR